MAKEFTPGQIEVLDRERRETEERARATVELAKKLKGIDSDPMNVLRSEADKEDRARETKMAEERAAREKARASFLERLKKEENRGTLPRETEREIAESGNDSEFMLGVVKISPSALEFADPSLRADREFMTKAAEAMMQTGHYGAWPIFRFGDPAIVNDKEFVLGVIKLRPDSFENVAEDLKKDRELVMAAVQLGYGQAFQYVDPSLRGDKGIVRAALRTGAEISRGRAMVYASSELQADREFVLEAIKIGGGEALEGASVDLKKDKKIVLAAVQSVPGVLRHADDSLRADKEVVMAAMEKSYSASEIGYADLSLRKDPGFMLETFRKFKGKYDFKETFAKRIPDELMKDKEFVLELLRVDFDMLRFLEWADRHYGYFAKLGNDPDFISRAMEIDKRALNFASSELRAELDRIARENGFSARVLRKVGSWFRRE